MLLQAIASETDYQISFISNQEFYLNHDRMKFKDGLFLVHGTRIRVSDPRDLLFELKSEGLLRVNGTTIKMILKTFHKLERNDRKLTHI